MGKLQENEQGFGVVELVLVLVIVALLGLGGWLMYTKNHNKQISGTQTAKTTTTSTPTQTTPVDETASWKTVDSIGGAYSIKVPDGWAVTNYPGNTLNGSSLTYTKGTTATVVTESNAYAGDQKKFNVTFSDKQYAAPQWQSPNQYGTETNADYSIGTITGKKYSIEYTQTVTGVTKGDKLYQYVFNLASGKQLTVLYMQNAGDADNLATVEKAIQTIVVH